MNRKSKLAVFLISVACLISTVLVGILLITPKVTEKNRQAAEEAALAEQERINEEKEHIRLELLAEDLVDFRTLEYDGIMLGMTGITEWSEEVPKFFLGLDILKNRAVINTPDEFLTFWEASSDSNNNISFACLILDPEKIYFDGEDMLNICDIIEANPQIQFRIFMPNYSKDYWYEKSFEEFDLLVSEYDDLMTRLITHENVVLSCHTGEDWILENNGIFCNKETGDLAGNLADKLFLYTYMDNWVVNNSNKDEKIQKIRNNCRKTNDLAAEKAAEDEFMTDYDVIFLGDSIFALSDGPYSVSSVMGEMTGARTYNCSKGGMGAVSKEDIYSMKSAVSHFVKGQPTGFEEWDVFDENIVEYQKKGHRDKETVIVLNCCINDYISSSDMMKYVDSFTECYEMLYEKYPEAKIVFMAPYYLQYNDNGSYPNERGLTMKDYVDSAKEVAENYGAYCLDLYETGKFNEENSYSVLEDGTHPTPAGCKEISKIMSEYFKDIFGKKVLN